VKRYFCTCCGEEHELDESVKPLTPEWFLERDAPSWFGVNDFENDTVFSTGICEECYDSLLLDGGKRFPNHDLLGE